jgi:TonB family protein
LRLIAAGLKSQAYRGPDWPYCAHGGLIPFGFGILTPHAYSLFLQSRLSSALSFVANAVGQNTTSTVIGQAVEARLNGRVVALRHVLADNSVKYDEAGNLTSKGKPGDWTLHGHFEVTSSEVRNGSLLIRGNRVALSFKEWERRKMPQYVFTSEQIKIQIVLNKNGPVNLEQELGKALLNATDEIPDNLAVHWHRFLCKQKQTTKGCSTVAYDAGVARPSEGGIKIPSVIRQKQPSFTKLAASHKLQGVVELLTLVNESGRVSSFEVIKPLGLGLEDKAIDAVRQWQFKPATQNGKPAVIYMVVQVNFAL